ncbi:MAG: hypothetical protein ACI9K2_000093 [Myxococcota bacterium]
MSRLEAPVEDIGKLFADVAAGERDPPEGGIERTRLLRRVRGLVLDGDAEERMLAVGVGARIGGADGLEMVGWYARDAEVDIRRKALWVGIDAEEAGVGVVRAFVEDTEPELALEAIGRVRRLVDRSVTQSLKRQLRHASPEVRAAAAEALGHVGGGSLVPVLRKTAEDGGAVAEAAMEAVDRILGKLPKAEPDPWWDVVEPEPERLVVEGPVELPETLPDDTLQLYRLLGGVKEEEREPVLEALKSRNDLWDTALGQAYPGYDPTTFRGVCIAATEFGRSDWIVTIRRRLPDPNASVRQAVARTLGVLGRGKPSLVMGLVDLLKDPVPEVRIAGVQAMGDLELSACKGFLERHRDDPDPEVRAAVAEAIARY